VLQELTWLSSRQSATQMKLVRTTQLKHRGISRCGNSASDKDGTDFCGRDVDLCRCGSYVERC